MIRVCFVCLGNICRSPTAEGVFRKLVAEAKLGASIEIDSAGTGDYHVGESPDSRARAAAQRHGYQLTGSARQFTSTDFGRFDHVLAMDEDNLRALKRIAPDHAARSKVHLLREFDASAPAGAAVPDPYYGGAAGFDAVIEICERACRGLLDHILTTELRS